MKEDIYCPCMFCETKVLLTSDYEGYVPGYWVICPHCLDNEPSARLWLSPFGNFFEIIESIEAKHPKLKEWSVND